MKKFITLVVILTSFPLLADQFVKVMSQGPGKDQRTISSVQKEVTMPRNCYVNILGGVLKKDQQILYKLDRKLGFSAYYQRGNEAVDITHCISPSEIKVFYIELLKKAQKEKRSNNIEWEMFAVEALGADAVFFLKMEAGLD